MTLAMTMVLVVTTIMEMMMIMQTNFNSNDVCK